MSTLCYSTSAEGTEPEAAEVTPDAAPVAEVVETAPEVEAEKEPEEMTLDEWKALQVLPLRGQMSSDL